MFDCIGVNLIVSSQALVQSIYLNNLTLWVSEDTTKSHNSRLTFGCPIKVELKRTIRRAEELGWGFRGGNFNFNDEWATFVQTCLGNEGPTLPEV